MSAILQGADKAYLREYNESEDERRLDALKSALSSVQQETKNAGYIQNGLVLDIQLAVRRIYEDLGMDVSDGSPYDEAEDAVRKATSDLESAIYSLDEQIKLEIKEVNSSISNTELGELEESPTYVDGFMGADGKLTSKPTAADYASNKEFQHMKKKLGDKIPQPTKRDADGKLSPFKKDELDEMYDEKAFDNIFKDRKDKGTMERPKSKPKDTEMYNQPNKAERDKRENDNIDEESKGLWANIHAKRKRGEKPAKKGDKAYPKTLDIDEEKQRLDPKCWDGYKKQGTKMKGGKKVNNCVPKESRIASSLRMVAEEYEREMEEGNGRLRGIAAGALLIGSLMGLNNKMAQEVYDNSHQLQQLTQIYQIAQERGDEEKMKDVKRRISNHKTRLDLGKGDVDFDGLPGNDDIKDIDYRNEPK